MLKKGISVELTRDLSKRVREFSFYIDSVREECTQLNRSKTNNISDRTYRSISELNDALFNCLVMCGMDLSDVDGEDNVELRMGSAVSGR